jgi:hypothetical protein
LDQANVQIVFLLSAYQSEPPEFFLACFCLVLCEPLFDSLSDFVWPLYCLSFANVFGLPSLCLQTVLMIEDIKITQGYKIWRLFSRLQEIICTYLPEKCNALISRYRLICNLEVDEVTTSRSFPRSWLVTRFVTRLTRRVSLVEQELATLSGVPEFTPGF